MLSRGPFYQSIFIYSFFLFSGWPQCSLLILVILLSQQKECQSDFLADAVTSGLEVGATLGEVLSEAEFDYEKLKNIIKNLGSFFKVLGPAVSIVMGFFEGDSKELTAIKALSAETERRFDDIDNKLEHIQSVMEWNNCEDKFLGLESKIRLLSMRKKNIDKAEDQKKLSRMNIFLQAYDSYNEAGYSLYRLLGKDNALGKVCGKDLLTHTENDVRRTTIVLNGMLQLLMKAAEIEVAYWTLRNDSIAAEDLGESWAEIMPEMLDVSYEYIKLAKATWYEQVGKDINNVMHAHSSEKDKSKLATALYNVINDKYYWRHWFVYVAPFVSIGKSFHVNHCGGYHKVKLNGFDVVVASVPKEQKYQDKAHVKLIVSHTFTYTKKSWRPSPTKHAKDVVNGIRQRLGSKVKPCGLIAILNGYQGAAKVSDVKRYYHQELNRMNVFVFF